MDDNEGGWKALKRAKAKKQTEAERLFHQYCDPKLPGWEDREWEILKEAALKILSSEFAEFIEENGLKGHPLHKKIYQADVGQLIIALVEYAHFNRIVNLPYFPPDVIRAEIIKEFDEHFRWVSEILQIAGVRKDGIQRKGQEWRKKLSTQVVAGKFPTYWREAIWEKIWPGHGNVPPKQSTHTLAAQAFADVFVGYVPEVLPAEWSNG